MMTIYQLVDEVCARDFPVLSMLTEAQYNDFVNIIYDYAFIILSWSHPSRIHCFRD